MPTSRWAKNAKSQQPRCHNVARCSPENMLCHKGPIEPCILLLMYLSVWFLTIQSLGPILPTVSFLKNYCWCSYHIICSCMVKSNKFSCFYLIANSQYMNIAPEHGGLRAIDSSHHALKYICGAKT
jgi:hypothetical protein